MTTQSVHAKLANLKTRTPHLQAVATAVATGQPPPGGENDQRTLDVAVEELSEVCRRNKRAREAAQAALLPPELHWVINA